MAQNARRLPARSREVKGATIVLDDSYNFDANGNVTDITDQAQAGLTTRGMAYDGLDRLSTVVAPGLWGNASYGYDALDNLRRADQGTRQYRYVYDAQLRLSQITNPAGTPQITLGYDARGNVTGKNSQAFVFDASNRLNQVTGQETYRYDGQGRRVQATQSDSTNLFWQYSQAGQVLYVSDTRRSRNTAYLYLGNTLVAMRHEAWGTGAVTVSYQHTDALGSPVAETDAAGAITQRHSYAPYGEAYNAPIDGPGYTGHVMDAATGLTYMQQRYYDPQIGRFLSADPVQTNLKTGENFNRYWYGNNNPYKFTDPDGRESKFVTENSNWLRQTTDPDVSPEESAEFDRRLDKALPELFGTEKGMEIKAIAIEQGGVTIRTNNDNQFNSVVGSKEVNVDPLGQRTVETTDGPQSAPLSVITGHELGHAVLGINDSGPGNMDNVNQVENPIRRELGIPERIEYKK